MIGYHIGVVLEHAVEIRMPFKVFDRNFKDFRDKHKLDNRFVYAVNSDGKFRLELKETDEPEKKEYLIRLSGWKAGKELHIRRIYVGGIENKPIWIQVPSQSEWPEVKPFKLYECVHDLLDLLEVWAVDHKGLFHFEYVDVSLGDVDTYCIQHGLEHQVTYSEEEVRNILSQLELEETDGYCDESNNTDNAE